MKNNYFASTMVSVLLSISFASTSFAQATSGRVPVPRPIPVPAPPTTRLPIPLPQKFKNIVYRGIIRDKNINLVQFLTHSEIDTKVDIASLGPNIASKFQALKNDVIKTGINFNPSNMDSLLRAIGDVSEHVDIDSLLWAIMMEATASESADLRDMMDTINNTNKQKQSQREKIKQHENMISRCKISNCELSLADLEASLQKTTEVRDSLNDLSEMEMLRMQMLMDRRQKAIETLSNLLKKMSETSATIVSNLK